MRKPAGDFLITTAKGALRGTLPEVCAWQAEMQGAFATIERGGMMIDVSNVDFDASDLVASIVACEMLFSLAR